MPAHHLLIVFPTHYDDQHKGYLSTQALIKLLIENLQYFRSTPYISTLNITERVT